MKAMLQGLRAVHSSGEAARFSQAYKSMRLKEGEPIESVHPVVRTHPETGRKSALSSAPASPYGSRT